MQQQQSYYEDCYYALNQYFKDKLPALQGALHDDMGTGKPGVPNPAPKTVDLLQKALCYGSYPNYVFDNAKAQKEITKRINILAKEFLVTLEDPFDESKLNIVEYSSKPTDENNPLYTNVGNQKSSDTNDLISFYAYFPVIQGEPYRLSNFLDTVQSKDQKTVGSIAYTKQLQSTLTAKIASLPSSSPNHLSSTSSNIWPITKIVLQKETFAKFQADVLKLKDKLGTTATGGAKSTADKFNTFATALTATYGTSGQTNYYENFKTVASFESALESAMINGGVQDNFEEKPADPPNNSPYTFDSLITDVNKIVAEYFVISPASVVLQPSVTFDDFTSAVQSLKSNLDDSEGSTLPENFNGFISDLTTYYDKGEELAYDTYASIPKFYQDIKDDLTNNNITSSNFQPKTGLKGPSGDDYSYTDFTNAIQKCVNDYFTIGASPEMTSNSLSEFEQKIRNLALIVTTNTKGIRQYTKNEPQISNTEFNATIDKLNKTSLQQLAGILQQVLSAQQTQEQLLTTDLANAKQRNKIIETNLNGRLVINVGNKTDAETIVRQLLKNEHIKENVFAIKLKYQQNGTTPPLANVEHSKIEIVYEQGVFSRLGFNLDYIDSIGNALKSEIVETIAVNGIKGESEFFPFYHKIGSASDFSSGLAWGDDYPITNKNKTFILERCRAIAQTMLFLTETQASVLSSTFKGNIVLMLQSEGRTASDPYFRNNDIDAYIPYLRYSVR